MAPRADVTVEIERKFEVTASDAVASLDPGVALGGAVPAEPEERLLEAVYYDTPDLQLLAEGVTLRRRTGGGDAGWHLKLPVAGDRREEVRLPLTRARAHPPAELACLVRAFARGRPVGPVAELRTHRRAWRSVDGAGVLVAELAADDVTGRIIGAEENASWREVEVELGPAAPAGLLDDVENRLAAMGLRRSTAPSKIGRLLAGRKADRGVGSAQSAPPGSAGSVVASYLQAQARAMRRCDPLVRLDREDAVHQMRVAARRMRSALQAFGRVLDRDRTRALTGELAWLAGELAPARDTEVMLARFEELLAALPGELVLGPVHAELTRAFARRGAHARARALAALDGDRSSRSWSPSTGCSPTRRSPAVRSAVHDGCCRARCGPRTGGWTRRWGSRAGRRWGPSGTRRCTRRARRPRPALRHRSRYAGRGEARSAFAAAPARGAGVCSARTRTPRSPERPCASWPLPRATRAATGSPTA